MGYGSHRSRDEGQLLLLDAQTLETVATVHLPQRVPMGFHGNWAASALTAGTPGTSPGEIVISATLMSRRRRALQ